MKCIKCGIEQPEDNFSWRYKNQGVRRKDCKTCVRLADKQRYQNPERRAKLNARTKSARQETIDKIWAYKSSHPCVDCGRTNPAGLEFDHLPQFEKSFNICQGPERGYAWKKIAAEIAKCEVVCGYCHGIRTHERAKRIRNVLIEV